MHEASIRIYTIGRVMQGVNAVNFSMVFCVIPAGQSTVMARQGGSAKGFPVDVFNYADGVPAAPPRVLGRLEWLSRDGNLLGGRVFFIVGTGPGRSGCVRMHVHASYSLESLGGFVLHHPRVLLPQVTMYMEEGGTVADWAVEDLLVQGTDRLIWLTQCVAAKPGA